MIIIAELTKKTRVATASQFQTSRCRGELRPLNLCARTMRLASDLQSFEVSTQIWLRLHPETEGLKVEPGCVQSELCIVEENVLWSPQEDGRDRGFRPQNKHCVVAFKPKSKDQQAPYVKQNIP